MGTGLFTSIKANRVAAGLLCGLLLFSGRGRAGAPAPASVDACVSAAAQSPPYFSRELDRCLATLPAATILASAAWTHPRKEIEQHVRLMLAQRLLLSTPMSPGDAQQLLTLTQANDTMHCRLELVEALATFPAGREALGKALDSGPADAFHLMTSIEYLAGARLGAFPQPVVRGFPVSEMDLSETDIRRVAGARAEIQRAYLTQHPLSILTGLAGWLYQDSGERRSGDIVIKRAVTMQGDQWLCRLARADATVPATQRPAREYFRERVLQGDPADASRLLNTCTFTGLPPGASLDQPAWVFDFIRRWLLALRPHDLDDKLTRRRAGALFRYLQTPGGYAVIIPIPGNHRDANPFASRTTAGTEHLFEDHERVEPGYEYPECNAHRIEPEYSHADLKMLGLAGPDAKPPAAREDAWTLEQKRLKGPLADQLRRAQDWAKYAKPLRVRSPLIHMGPVEEPQ